MNDERAPIALANAHHTSTGAMHVGIRAKRARTVRARASALALAVILCLLARERGDASERGDRGDDGSAKASSKATSEAMATATKGLKEILTQGERDGGGCVRGAFGRFYAPSIETLRETQRRIERRIGFAWVRWGDAEMSKSRIVGTDMYDAVRGMASMARTPETILNVGAHWLCQDGLKAAWNAAMEGANASDTALHSFFYYPMGDVADDGMPGWREKGVLGWTEVARASERKVILVGPPHVSRIPFVKHDVFIDASNAASDEKRTREVIEQTIEAGEAMDEPPLVVACAGFVAKTMVMEMQTQVALGWGFLDVGTALDGYAGIKSRDYNDPAVYCRKARERQKGADDGVDFWFAPGVCDKHPA